MNASSALSDLQQSFWRDRKRLSWLLSVAVPLAVGSGPVLYLLSGRTFALWLPLLGVYLLLPLLDWLGGTEQANPPDSALEALSADRYYRWVTWAIVPLLWAVIVLAAWFVSRHPLPWHALLAVVVTTGVVGGFCINVGHELGHRRNRLERWLAKLVLAPTGYGHFYVEHNRGHHRDVATPEDPASARLGESWYAFVLREWPGAWRRAWQLETARMQGLGRSRFSLHNDIVQTTLITVALWVGLALWLGAPVLLFLLAAAVWANLQLSSANYIEHYGLARKRLPSGRYEPCQPQHSWNSNHRVSNWALFHLQRHSDHHAHATRRYQALRHHDSAPQLPTGYFGMFLLAYVPPLWFQVMNPRLIAAVDSERDRINLQPGYETKLEALLSAGQVGGDAMPPANSAESGY